MRVDSNPSHPLLYSTLESTKRRMADLEEKIVLGKRLIVPSDDPMASVCIQRSERVEAAYAQYCKNIQGLNTRLSINEVHLDGMMQDLLQAQDLLVWGLNGVNSGRDLMAMEPSLRSVLESLFSMSNAQDQEGHYLFSGTLVTTPTVSIDQDQGVGARYRFSGNTHSQSVIVGYGMTQSPNVKLGDITALLNSLDGVVDVFQHGMPDPTDPRVNNTLRHALGHVDDALQKIGGLVAELGSAQHRLQRISDSHGNIRLNHQNTMNELERLDYFKAFDSMNAYLGLTH